jgi:penicillin G amidase
MKYRFNIDFLFPLSALIILVFTLSHQIFILPPVGKLVDPFVGVVQNEDEQDLNSSLLIKDDIGLADSTQVFFDERKVPHIYARNTTDLYFAQGYVTARLRLWQMDFLAYVSAGRLSEIFSDGLLDYDRNQRRIGMLEAAKASLKMMERSPESIQALTAYTRGVNAYIKQLNYSKIPFEYKMLDYEPEPWSNLKTVLLMKYMAAMLSGYDEDYMMTNLMLALGEERFNKLFPDFGPYTSPLMSDSASKCGFALGYIKKPAYLDYSFWASRSFISKSSYDPRMGSNSWAVSGKKTRSGYPILCNDPHLGLSLPAIWLEMQLSDPDENVYGVSIPGVPAVIIGFDKDIAWGITNGEGDARDWYKLKVSEDYRKYQFNGKWLNLTYTVEEIKRRGQKTFYDTIYHTVQGPIVNDRSFPGQQSKFMNYALKWELHNPSNEILTYMKLNRARNYADYAAAIREYCSPIQNFTFACKDNTIAANYQGNIAIKWPGEGKFVLDGTRGDHLYSHYIPTDSLPHLINPKCNYVVSANQHPTSCSYPYYYDGYYIETRAGRIKQLLDSEIDLDPRKMQAIQLDNVSQFARDALPVLTNTIDEGRINESERIALRNLKKWKGVYNYDDENAELFELWWKNIREYTWDEFRSYSFDAKTPDDYVLLNLITTDPENEYFDNLSTSIKENAGEIIHKGFSAAVTSYNELKRGGSVQWSRFNTVNIMHLTNLPLLSRTGIPSAGQLKAINSISGNVGPSWRMVVELGERPLAYGIYAGGQSGNVAGRYFDSFITDWNQGKYYRLNYFISINEASSHATSAWVLK